MTARKVVIEKGSFDEKKMGDVKVEPRRRHWVESTCFASVYEQAWLKGAVEVAQ